MKTENFNYHLPRKLIAQEPVRPRDASRLMIVDRTSGKISEDYFYNLDKYLQKGDILVFNNTRVVPARLFGRRLGTGGKIKILLIKKIREAYWQALISGHRRRPGLKINFTEGLTGEVIKKREQGIWLIKFNQSGKIFQRTLQKIGQTPTPPYIKKTSPLSRYQTIFAKNSGSVAAPTAGLHFTKKLFKKLKQQGIQIEFVTLHIGLGTFAPIRQDNVENHQIHSEWAKISRPVCRRFNQAKKQGRRIIAVGTTSCRVLETAASKENQLQSFSGQSRLFIFPPYKFKFVDGLVTNFHLSKSTLLLLVSAFAGRDLIFKSYHQAIQKKFRFYSFGDAMLIF